MNTDTPSTETLDARNLLCPLPVIKTQKKIKTMRTGETLLVIASDPGVKHDIPAWCRIHDHQVLEVITQGNDIHITICVGA